MEQMKPSEKDFLTINEFAKQIGITTQTLRRWDKEGKLKPHHRTPNGYRIYAKSQISRYFAES